MIRKYLSENKSIRDLLTEKRQILVERPGVVIAPETEDLIEILQLFITGMFMKIQEEIGGDAITVVRASTGEVFTLHSEGNKMMIDKEKINQAPVLPKEPEDAKSEKK